MKHLHNLALGAVIGAALVATVAIARRFNVPYISEALDL